MIENKLQQLFKGYLTAFKSYDLDGVTACYHLPCSLNTPDNVVLLSDKQQCRQEFTTIFAQLKGAQTSNIIARKISYQQVHDTIYIACIDWDFLDGNGQVFADFAAIYHVVEIAGEFKIINVVSHDLTNSLSLGETFEIS